MSITQSKTPLSPPSPRESFWKSIFSAAIAGFAMLMFFYSATIVRKGLTPETYNFYKEYLNRCLENISQGEIKKYLIPTETWISAATISLTTIKQKQWSDIRNYSTGQLEQEIKKKKALFYAIASLASVSAIIAVIGTVCLYKNSSVENWFLSSVLWFAFYVISRIPSFMTGDNIELSLTYAEAIKALGRSYVLSDGRPKCRWRTGGKGVSKRENSRSPGVGEWFKQFISVSFGLSFVLTLSAICLLCFIGHLSASVATIAIAPLVSVILFKVLVAPAIVRRFVVGGDVGAVLQMIVYLEIFVFVFVSAFYNELIRHGVAHPNQWCMNVFNAYGTPAAVFLWLCVGLSLCSVFIAMFFLIFSKSLRKTKIQKIVWSRSADLSHTKLLKSNGKFCKETRRILEGVSVDALLKSIESEHLSEGHKTRYLNGLQSAPPSLDDRGSAPPSP